MGCLSIGGGVATTLGTGTMRGGGAEARRRFWGWSAVRAQLVLAVGCQGCEGHAWECSRKAGMGPGARLGHPGGSHQRSPGVDPRPRMRCRRSARGPREAESRARKLERHALEWALEIAARAARQPRRESRGRGN